MWVVYILLALLVLLLLLLLIPVYGRIVYDGQQLRVKVYVLGLPIKVLPMAKKSAQSNKKIIKKDSCRSHQKDKPSKREELVRLVQQDDVGAALSFLKKLAKIAKEAAGRALRSITVDCLQLQICVAAGDAEKTAFRYGQVCSVLYPSLAVIERIIRVRRHQLRVEPNFLREQGGMRCDVRLHVSVIKLICAGVYLLVHFLTIKETEELQSIKEDIENGQ